MLTADMWQMDFISLIKHHFLTKLLRSSIMNGCCILSNAFPTSKGIIICLILFCITVINF